MLLLRTFSTLGCGSGWGWMRTLGELLRDAGERGTGSLGRSVPRSLLI